MLSRGQLKLVIYVLSGVLHSTCTTMMFIKFDIAISYSNTLSLFNDS